MAFEPRDMSGTLFKNERKTQDNHPDYQGNAMVNGVNIDLAAWIKESANGKKRLSISFKNKEESAQNTTTVNTSFDDSDLDAPF